MYITVIFHICFLLHFAIPLQVLLVVRSLNIFPPCIFLCIMLVLCFVCRVFVQ